MLESFYSFGVLTPIFVAIALAVLIAFCTRYYYKPHVDTEYKFDRELFKLPTDFSIQVLGIIVPILAVFTGYIVSKVSVADIDFLLATIAIYFLVIFIATWQAFSIARAKVEGEKLSLSWKNDHSLIVANAIMYELIAAGFICLVLFFLFELNPKQFSNKDISSQETVLIMRPSITIGMNNSEVVNLWGMPSGQDAKANTWHYNSANAHIAIFFDSAGTVTKIITEQRKNHD